MVGIIRLNVPAIDNFSPSASGCGTVVMCPLPGWGAPLSYVHLLMRTCR